MILAQAAAIDWTTILLALIALIGTLFTPLVTLYVGSKINASVDKGAAENAKTAETIKEVHVAVNSGADKIQRELKEVREQNAALSALVATLAEKARVEDERKRDKVIASQATSNEKARAGAASLVSGTTVAVEGVLDVSDPKDKESAK